MILSQLRVLEYEVTLYSSDVKFKVRGGPKWL